MKKILFKTGLNSREIFIICFLFAAFLTGILIRYSGWKKPAEYDYSESDKNFEHKLSSSFDELKNSAADGNMLKRAAELEAFADSLGIKYDGSEDNKPKITPGTNIDINSAGVQELLMLPGIGNVTAEKIIEYRNIHGKFRNTEELMNIKGIGEKKFEAMKNFISASQ